MSSVLLMGPGSRLSPSAPASLPQEGAEAMSRQYHPRCLLSLTSHYLHSTIDCCSPLLTSHCSPSTIDCCLPSLTSHCSPRSTVARPRRSTAAHPRWPAIAHPQWSTIARPRWPAIACPWRSIAAHPQWSTVARPCCSHSTINSCSLSTADHGWILVNLGIKENLTLLRNSHSELYAPFC